jgi:hypothetical protein
MTLSGKTFPDGKIEDAKFPDITKHIIEWLLVEDILKSFAKIDSKQLFEIMFKLFEGKLSKVLID